MAATHGGVCYHPCEDVCNRAFIDSAVSIHAVERYLGDLALKEDWQFEVPATKSGRKVLVVGAGPSGLSAAYHLARLGHEVEIREAGDLWGMGTFGVTKALRTVHGPQTRVVSCGQAGEQRSRSAVLQTETGNAAGQGGYGGLMGAKRLKAIAVRGTQGIRVADYEAFLEAYRVLRQRLDLATSRDMWTPVWSTSPA